MKGPHSGEQLLFLVWILRHDRHGVHPHALRRKRSDHRVDPAEMIQVLMAHNHKLQASCRACSEHSECCSMPALRTVEHKRVAGLPVDGDRAIALADINK
jgi:hypothetical protein